MDYDIGSFLAGVQVGLRLGRKPQRPFSPVPSGKYILTESGEHILTELTSTEDVTILSFDTWYQAGTATGEIYPGHYYRMRYGALSADYEGFWVMGRVYQDVGNGYFAYIAQNSDGNTYYLDISTHEPPQVDNTLQYVINGYNAPNGWKFQDFPGIHWGADPGHDYPLVGVTPIICNTRDDFGLFVASVKSVPVITEGG